MTGRLSGHCMMPTFHLLDEDEVTGNPALSDLEPRHYPRISIDDPAVLSIRQELGLSADDVNGRVIKFLRRSLNAGISPYYRIIVDTPIGTTGAIWSVQQ